MADEERCAPEVTGFASEVERLVAESRAAERLRQLDAIEANSSEKERAEMLGWLVELGASEAAVELSLDSYELQVKLATLRKLAADARAAWAPNLCPWVGFIDDEVIRTLKEAVR